MGNTNRDYMTNKEVDDYEEALERATPRQATAEELAEVQRHEDLTKERAARLVEAVKTLVAHFPAGTKIEVTKEGLRVIGTNG